ncbi:MAG: hypothetical protein ACRD1K_20785 [Acidimicrobiales bacterium]
MSKRVKYPKPPDFKPETVFRKPHKSAGLPRCLAWKPNLGRQCNKVPMRLMAGGHPADPTNYSTVCELDGGKSARGIEHWNYRGKGYSRFVPAPLEPAITAFLQAADPLELVQAIATWEGRIESLLRSIDQAGAPAELWAKLQVELEGLWAAIDNQQIERALQHRQTIDQLVRTGQTGTETWDQLQRAEETRLKLIETEHKKRERLRGYVSAEQLRFQNNALRIAVVEAVQLIEDPDTQRKVRTAIAERFIQIVGPAALPGPAAGDDPEA